MAAKKPAKKAAKSAKKATARPIRKVAKKSNAKKQKPTARKAAPARKVTKVKSRKPAKVAKAQPAARGKAAPPAPAKTMPAIRSRPGRPPRAVKEHRQVPPMPAPGLLPASPMRSAVKPAPAPSPKDLAAAHEYLLARSATRSEEPITVNGKRLPTEEELLKTGESDYMNTQQLAFFRHRLQKMESELLENADQTTEHLRETVIVPDPADRATIEEEHALELRTRDRERKLLKKVQQALARIDSGEYGYCEETGDPIGIPRLLARPTATLSLEAQQRREMKQKMFGD